MSNKNKPKQKMIEVTLEEFEALKYVFRIPEGGTEIIYKDDKYAKAKINHLKSCDYCSIVEEENHWLVTYSVITKNGKTYKQHE